MGLAEREGFKNVKETGFYIRKQSACDKVVALAGNPNVGKSTVFNKLTGLRQHTGNWPGKTVSNAQGYCSYKDNTFVIVDIPGCYSLMAQSAEEEVARDFICFGSPDAVIVVCDATCLERNLNLVLQTIEICENSVVLVNLMDEAMRKNIYIDTEKLSRKLGVPVLGTSARKAKDLNKLLLTVSEVLKNKRNEAFCVKYGEKIENAINMIEPTVKKICGEGLNSRWLSIRLLDKESTLLESLDDFLGYDLQNNQTIIKALNCAFDYLKKNGIKEEDITDIIVGELVRAAEKICADVVIIKNKNYNQNDRKIDRIITGKFTGFPIMLLLLGVVFWLTLKGSNYPSQLLYSCFFWLESRLVTILSLSPLPAWFVDMLVFGVYRVVAWVVSVMLPPMAIFFPLFTLLEDLGYLPRVAFNLDKAFKKCSACGKQSLTMCMGFGCNAAGIVGCRIIDSKRERLIAMLTNNFVPCNGRFPILIAVISMFFLGVASSFKASLNSVFLLLCIIILGVIMTFISSKILSKTVLKGVASSFTLELPPYRKPQIGKIIVRSLFDRTLFVLGRAVSVAAPSGLIIWVLANTGYKEVSLLANFSSFLDPFAKLMGLDGVMLMAFILGIPANEIVIPLAIMTYMAESSLIEISNLVSLKELLVQNGWSWITAVSTMLFTLMHWPCATTLLTIKKESGGYKWMIVAFLLPTICGIILCVAFASIAKIFL